ncbi:rhodanese-like domain-containing protein [Halofilum ochraceum]|uniref:rhodanese-like domain-containing protein n=1 Tax=Halofilum ochraceum TaxID=1611323 RepID=UPI0008D8FE24|nr:rhodanese-like domain-containing protein [Halofilum ochraceum]
MAQTITKGVNELLAEANARIETIPVDQAMALVDSDDHVLIDLRESGELRRMGKIPGAVACPRGMLEFWIDSDNPEQKAVFDQDKTYVFYCASAKRSALAARTAQEMGLGPVAHIEGGFGAWVKAGGPVEQLS